MARRLGYRAGPLALWAIWLNQRKMSKSVARDGASTHAVIEEGRETLGETVLPVEYHAQVF
jgi:hypothetical protein